MIALYDFLPTYCPNCGAKLRWAVRVDQQGATINDYWAKASHNCACGMHYQYVTTGALRETAKANGGDLANYA